jgi:hypothetical protein
LTIIVQTPVGNAATCGFNAAKAALVDNK